MEPQQVILAKLVLGYLKSEKCKTAYREFLKTSPNLQQIETSQKYIATRFLGLSLEDIINEYLELIQIVQGRLEATNYYNEDHTKESIVDQLLYLLNKVSSSRPSTPGYSSPQGSHGDDRSPSHSDLDATRADTLPGNTPSDQSFSPRRKGRFTKKAPITSSPIEKAINTEILAENLLENREFHEKIAQTINKVVEKQFDTTVKEVIQETEQDPIFDKILDDIIGSSNIIDLQKASESVANNKKEKKNDSMEVSSEKELSKERNDNISLGNNLSINFQQKPTFSQVANMDYILTSQGGIATSTCIQNPLYINTVTGLLIPPVTTVVLNKPQPALIPSPILTEQEIMKMPIILKDDTQSTTNNKEKTNQLILPKSTKANSSETTQELKNYFKNYVPDKSPATKLPGLKRVIYPKTRKTTPVKKNINEPTIILPDSSNAKKPEIIEILSSESKKNITPGSLVEVSKKATPKSGSHIRNLDFSSPPKLDIKKKSDADLKESKGKNEQKHAVKSLFKENEGKAWDADLRSAVQIKEVEEKPTKKVPAKKTRKPKSKKSCLNTTEQEALMLEEAIKTPMKKDSKEENTLTEENIPKSQVKTILSPSKLNATKNHIVETNTGEKSKFITPDLAKETVTHPIKANRNLTPMLETPFKYNQLPKTPGVMTPFGFNDDGTPITKMLDANLNGVDISSIETPCLLNTPGFPPHTPSIDFISPYANRPTDYSTGSSYYQPSDNEQNKILEAQLREVEKASCTNKESGNMSEHLQIFNKNIIGKKNLNLLKHDIPSENSYSSSGEEMDWAEKESNDTVIFKSKTKITKCSYSLRTRGKSLETPKKKPEPTKINKKRCKTKKDVKKEEIIPTTEVIKSIISNNVPLENPEVPSSDLTPSQFSVLKELESKKERTIKSIKTSHSSPKKPKKQTNGKFKIKPIAKVFTTKTSKKAESPRKRKRNKEMLKTVMNDLATSDDSEIHFSLSEDDEAEAPVVNAEKVDKTASDVEAQNLIEGLKERGIHLMQNKSPKKNSLELDNSLKNTSDVQLESYDREVFDRVTIEDCIHMTYDETKASTKPTTTLKETGVTEYLGKLYLESIDKEIDVHLKATNIINLLNLSGKNTKREKESKTKNSDVKDNTITPSHSKDIPTETSTSPRGSIKRKLSDDSESENSRSKLLKLKSLNVDHFLNIIHKPK